MLVLQPRTLEHTMLTVPYLGAITAAQPCPALPHQRLSSKGRFVGERCLPGTQINTATALVTCPSFVLAGTILMQIRMEPRAGDPATIPQTRKVHLHAGESFAALYSLAPYEPDLCACRSMARMFLRNRRHMRFQRGRLRRKRRNGALALICCCVRCVHLFIKLLGPNNATIHLKMSLHPAGVNVRFFCSCASICLPAPTHC